jgi:hypothetical protein
VCRRAAENFTHLCVSASGGGSSAWRGRGKTHNFNREHFMKVVFERIEGSQVIPTGCVKCGVDPFKIVSTKRIELEEAKYIHENVNFYL